MLDPFRSPLLLVALLALPVAGPARGATLVVPLANETVEGNSQSPVPFGTALGILQPMRGQQVYDASAFQAAASGPVTITAIRFRADQSTTSTGPNQYDQIDVHLSTTSAPVDGLDPTLDPNVGSDDTQVFSGTFIWDPCGPGTATCGLPFPFDLEIPFSTPFVYDPSQGNLLLDVTNGLPNQLGFFLDMTDVEGDTVSRVTVSSSATVANTTGLVTQFVYTAPEPASAAVAATALLALLGLRRARS
jgi:hypothetical protein